MESVYGIKSSHITFCFGSQNIRVGTDNDLDIYITDNSGRILFGFNRDNRGGDPLEILSFSVSTAVTSVGANIMVVKANTSTDDIRFKYVIFRGEADILEHNTG